MSKPSSHEGQNLIQLMSSSIVHDENYRRVVGVSRWNGAGEVRTETLKASGSNSSREVDKEAHKGRKDGEERTLPISDKWLRRGLSVKRKACEGKHSSLPWVPLGQEAGKLSQ